MTKGERTLVGAELAASLRNRMALEGWLHARVQPRWISKPRGDHLILEAVPGVRWTVAGVSWHLEAAGLGGLLPTAQGLLASGAPFSNSLLREVQSKFAQRAASMGYATFHEGLLVIEADTVTSSTRQQVHLNLWAQGRGTDGRLDDQADSMPATLHHPLAFQGQVSYHGTKGPEAGQIIGGLSSEVWDHLVDWQPGDVHGEAKLTAAVQRLQRLSRVRHVAVESSLREELDSLRMDVDLQVQHGAPYDLSLELDLVRNNVRYGPRVHLDLAALNARSRGGRRSVKVGVGYVAAEPFSTFSRDAWLNSAEWSLHWNAERLGVWPLSLGCFNPKSEPRTRFDAGVDREIWPEFTRTQLQSDVSFVLKTGRSSGGRVEWVPMKVSYVNLTNRSSEFLEWLEFEASPLVAGRFINHLNVGSTLLWTNSWSGERLTASVSLQSSWGGWLRPNGCGTIDARPIAFSSRDGCVDGSSRRAFGATPTAHGSMASRPQSVALEALESACSRSSGMGRGGGQHSVVAFGTLVLVRRSQWHPRPQRLGSWGLATLNPENVNLVVEAWALQAMLSMEWRCSLGVSLGPCLVRRRWERLAAWGGCTGGDEMGRHGLGQCGRGFWPGRSLRL